MLASISIITVDARGGSSVTSSLRSAASDVFTPVFNLVDDVTQPIGDFFAGSFNYGALSAENAQLRSALSKLQLEQSSTATIKAELTQVLALQHLSFAGSIPTVLAQRIGGSSSNYTSTITINEGTLDGVVEGMPVVGSGGLVGTVISSASSSAVVRLITDGGSAVGVSSADGSINATAQGEGPTAAINVQFVAPSAHVRRGEVLSTSGTDGGLYPVGIPVGTVASATSSVGAAQPSVTLTPSADLSKLSYVSVLLWSPTS